MKINFSSIGEINPFTGPHLKIKVLNKYIGLIIGKNGDTVRNLNQKTGCCIFIPKDSKEGEDFRMLELSGSDESIKECKKEIEFLIENANKVTEALYQSIDFDYLNTKQTNQIISPNEIMTNINEKTALSANNTPLNINNRNIIYNQPRLQTASTNTYAYNYYPINNLNAITARVNLPGIPFNNAIYPQTMNMNTLTPGVNNPLNLNNFNLPPLNTPLPVPVIQHMSINNFPSTTFVNFSNNLTQNHINIQSATQPNQNNVGSKNVRSENLEEKNLNKSGQNMVDKKKKEDTSKKSSNSILNYIYGGQVK
jgi:rRNA processing protein Krr1/Pno1